MHIECMLHLKQKLFPDTLEFFVRYLLKHHPTIQLIIFITNHHPLRDVSMTLFHKWFNFTQLREHKPLCI